MGIFQGLGIAYTVLCVCMFTTVVLVLCWIGARRVMFLIKEDDEVRAIFGEHKAKIGKELSMFGDIPILFGDASKYASAETPSKENRLTAEELRNLGMTEEEIASVTAKS